MSWIAYGVKMHMWNIHVLRQLTLLVHRNFVGQIQFTTLKYFKLKIR